MKTERRRNRIRGLTIKGHQATVWSDGNILYFDSGGDSGGDYKTLCVCQNAQNRIPKRSVLPNVNL